MCNWSMPNGLNLWRLKKQWKWGSRVLAMFDFFSPLPPTIVFSSMQFWSHFVDWTKNLSFIFFERESLSETRPGNRQTGQLFHEFQFCTLNGGFMGLCHFEKQKHSNLWRLWWNFWSFWMYDNMMPPVSLFKVVL